MNCKIIRGGFSFCGVDIADLGLSYAPENENTYVYKPADINVHEETFDGHDGGYLYGVTRQPKEFILRCYFEDEAIDQGIMERVYNLFRNGKSGKLIFSRRPWCYYFATVTSLPHPELTNYLNGLITITMKASYPFARGDDFYYDPYENNFDSDEKKFKEYILENTGLLEKEAMIPEKSFSDISLTVSDDPYSVVLHNPGTENAPLSIMLAGNAGAGVIIRNKTTKQECKVIAMDNAHTSSVNKYVYIDGINGSTSLVSENGDKEPAFVYHDSGYIHLAPSYPVIRNVYLRDSVSDTITLINTLYEDVVGKHICIGNQWYKIVEQLSGQQYRIDRAADTSTTDRTVIALLNEIEIVPVDEINLTHLSFNFKPTYA